MRSLLIVVAALAVAGCSTPGPATPPPSATGPAPPVSLAATLASPTDVTLTWSSHLPQVAGWAVEFATDPDGPYTNLAFAPPGTTTYRHPDLMPKTHFYYRIRPVLGPASPPVDVTLPSTGANDPNDDGSWAAPTRAPQPAVARLSVREPAAAPTDLRATVVGADGIRFSWTDRASDAEGYLLEVRPAGSTDYRVADVLDPDVNTVGLVTQPDERVASYRVRAYRYGFASNVASATTGD